MKPTPIEHDNLVKALVAARDGADVTQKEIAERAGCSRSYIAKIEDGLQLPPAHVIRAYADLCNMDGDVLCQRRKCLPEDIFKKLMDNPSLWGVVRTA